MLGKRNGLGSEPIEPHDATMTVLGAGLLWFGWFGFNAGSALAANGLAASAFVDTNTAAAMAALTWMTVSWMHHGRPSVLGAAAGAVAGLVAITPAAGYVDVPAAIVIGLGAGIVCYFAVDISRSASASTTRSTSSACTASAARWGAFATGLFATKLVNPAGNDGLFYGNPQQLVHPAHRRRGRAGVYAIAVSWVILKVIDLLVGLRVPEAGGGPRPRHEQHGEVAYQL